MSKKELMTLTVAQLRDEAKGYKITGRWDMNKMELIEAILRAEKAKVGNDETNTSANDEEKIDNHRNNIEPENKVEKESDNVDMSQKLQYIENAAVGTLVAFKVGDKVKSAKIVNRSTSKRKLRVETEYKAVFIINFEDVIWVRTGARWPRGVYNLLKGRKSNGEEKVSA